MSSKLNAPSLKLRRWLLAAETSPPGQYPPLPVITIEDLAPDHREVVKGWYHRRNWESCENSRCTRTGTQHKLMKCAGCGNVPGCRTLYCSRRCQHADWPRHKQLCGEQAFLDAQQSALEASSLGVKASVWENCNIREPKRLEGLKLISIWAFDQIERSHPRLDRKKLSLAIHCRSTRGGKGSIVPIAFHLESMVESANGLPPAHLFRSTTGAKLGVIQVIVDQVGYPREFVDLNVHADMGYYIQQWPWIFATIASMNNNDRQLANFRLQHLYPLVDTMARHGVPEVLHFKAPTNLDNSVVWPFVDFAKWQKHFGDVISF